MSLTLNICSQDLPSRSTTMGSQACVSHTMSLERLTPGRLVMRGRHTLCIPFGSHCRWSLNSISSPPRSLVGSALLHDVIEDSDVTRTDLSMMFDEQIAEIVWLLTKLEDVSLREYLARIEAAAETGAPIVKLCDRLDNMRSVLDTPNLEKKRRYIRTTEELYLPLASRTNAYLRDELSRSLEEARNQLRMVLTPQ